MKRFAGSRLELYLLKSERERVLNGYGFGYEIERLPETERILSEIHNIIALRKVSKSVSYRRASK